MAHRYQNSHSTVLSPARSRAFAALRYAEEHGSFVRDVFSRSADRKCADSRDEAFALRLALGVVSTSGVLDDCLNSFLERPRSVSADVRCALRIATFELLYLDAAPSVAVSQGVELARSCSRGAAGLANAVLRRVADAADSFLCAVDADEPHRMIVSRARRAGLPVWLVRELEASLGDRAAELLDSQLDPAPIAAHLNPHRGCALGSSEVFPGCVEIDDASKLIASTALDLGDAVVSDLTAQLIATAATRPGSCLEIGAGRGTKTFIMSCQGIRAGYEREHVALDLFEWKCRANTDRIERAGLPGFRAVAADALDLGSVLSVDGYRAQFDTVFVDAPCSGTGTMRRHIEIPWRLGTSDVRSGLPSLQRCMLEEASKHVSLGGELVYATCSVLRRENVDVIDSFLSSDAGAGFELVPLSDAQIFRLPGFEGARGLVSSYEDERGRLQTVPAREGFDGHFCARMVRTR